MDYCFYKVKAFELIGNYSIEITFDDGRIVLVDLEPVLVGELYGPLRDKRLFNEVKIDPEVNTLVWPNGADFDPNTLHDWDEKKHYLIREAAKWELVAA